MDTEFVRNRIAELIKQRGLSMRQLSVSAGLGDQLVRNILTRRTQKIAPQTLSKILTSLDMTEDRFFERTPESVRVPAPEMTCSIPVFGEIPAGNPTWIEGNQVPTEYVAGDERDRRRQAFALRVSGRSMEPKYMPGDLLVLRPLSIPLPIKDPKKLTPRATFDALHGRTVAVLLNGEATLKVLEVEPVKDGDYFLHLRPINPAYQTITVQPNDEALFQGEVYKSIREE